MEESHSGQLHRFGEPDPDKGYVGSNPTSSAGDLDVGCVSSEGGIILR